MHFWTLVYKHLFKSLLSVISDLCLGAELLGDGSMFKFLRDHQTFPQILYYFKFPPVIQKGSNFASSVTFFISGLVLNNSYPSSHSSVSKESACNAGELGSIPELGRSPGEGNDNPLQYSCLKNPMGRGAWWATVHGVARVGYDLATKPPPQPHPNEYAVASHCVYDLYFLND